MKKLAAGFLVLVLVFTCLPAVVYACCAPWNWAGQGHWEYRRTPTTLQGCEDNLSNCEYDYTDHGIFFYIVTRVWVYDYVDGGDAL